MSSVYPKPRICKGGFARFRRRKSLCLAPTSAIQRPLPTGGNTYKTAPADRCGRFAMTRTIFFLALAAASTAFAAGGQVYKWTDAQGVVHYSDAPPPTTQTNVQTVRVTGGDRPHDVAPMSSSSESGDAQQQPGQNQVASNAPTAAVDHSKDCAT